MLSLSSLSSSSSKLKSGALSGTSSGAIIQGRCSIRIFYTFTLYYYFCSSGRALQHCQEEDEADQAAGSRHEQHQQEEVIKIVFFLLMQLLLILISPLNLNLTNSVNLRREFAANCMVSSFLASRLSLYQSVI